MKQFFPYWTIEADDSDVSVRYLWIFLGKKYIHVLELSRLSTKASLFCEKNYLTLSIEKKWISQIGLIP